MPGPIDGLKQAAAFATRPLVPQIQQGWDQLANLVDPPNTNQADRGTVAPFLAGAMHGLGGVAGSLTSPVGIGLALAGLSGSGPKVGAPTSIPSDLPAPNLPPEFTAVGEEPPYTAPRFQTDPKAQAYQNIMAKQAAFSKGQ